MCYGKRRVIVGSRCQARGGLQFVRQEAGCSLVGKRRVGVCQARGELGFVRQEASWSLSGNRRVGVC